MRKLLVLVFITFAIFAVCLADPSDEVSSTDALPDVPVVQMVE